MPQQKYRFFWPVPECLLVRYDGIESDLQWSSRAQFCSILLRELNFSGRLADQPRFKPLVTYKLTQIHLSYAYDHTTMNTPVLV